MNMSVILVQMVNFVRFENVVAQFTDDDGRRLPGNAILVPKRGARLL